MGCIVIKELIVWVGTAALLARNPDHGLTWVCRNLDELKGLE